MKKLFEIYYGFGKGEGFELYNSKVMEDTKENRIDLIENEFSHWDDSTYKEKFIEGEESIAYFDRYGVNWDESTTAYVETFSYEEKLEEIENKRNEEIEKLNKLFNI